MLQWLHRLSGPYSQLPGVTRTLVQAPTGAAVDAAIFPTYRYRLTSVVTVWEGRVWVAYNTGGTNEGAAGQHIHMQHASNGASPSFSAPVRLIEPQGPFDPVGASHQAGDYRCAPKDWHVYDNRLFVIAPVRRGLESGGSEMIGTIAREVLANGTLQTPFRLDVVAWAEHSAPYPVPAYDATLSPALSALNDASLKGSHNWGDAQIIESVSLPTGVNEWVMAGRLRVSGNEQYRLGITRGTGPASARAFGQIAALQYPNSDNMIAGTVLPNGDFVLVSSTNQASRTPLVASVHDASTGDQKLLGAIEMTLPAAPVYAGSFKDDGYSYPSVHYDAGRSLLHVVFARGKEDIYHCQVPLASLTV